MDDKPIIHFSHANGFPGSCYQQLFNVLKNHYEIGYIDTIGHNANYPVTDNWHYLVAELINYIEQFYQQPVIGVGHSLGGVLTYIAAVQRPELFKLVILLDSPVLGRLSSLLVKIVKQLGLIERLSPATRTKTRKRHWKNTEAAMNYLQSKEVFQNFTIECLQDYIIHGMETTPNGLQLKFDVNVEYEIYKTLPHDFKKYRHQLQVPMGLIYGEKSDVIGQQALRSTLREISNLITQKVPGGHLFPFEHPQVTGDAIINLISRFN